MLSYIHSDGISISIVGIILGLLLGALVYVLAEWLAARAGAPILRVVGAIIAVLVFVALAFGIG